MLQTSHQKRHPFRPTNWSLVTLIFAACGGGGGGGGGTPTTTQSAPGSSPSSDESPPITVEPLTFAEQSDGSELAEIEENRRIVDHVNRGTAPVESFTVINSHLAELKQSGETGSAITRKKISGPDAHLFTFVQNGPKHVVVAFITTPDYENPRDVDGDNVYNIESTTYFSNGKTRESRFKYKLVIKDLDDGATTVSPSSETSLFPKYVRQSNHIKIEVIEGTTAVFEYPYLAYWKFHYTPPTEHGERVNSPDLVGDDASGFTGKTITRGGKRLAVIEFADAPDFDNPTDTNGDNTYEFRLSDSIAEHMGPLTFEVTVLDVV